jgi:RHS repeat-associated protein
VTDTAGETILNTYDTQDRLVTQTTPRGTMSYEYDPLGRRRSMTEAGAAPVSYGYDTNSRLVRVAEGLAAPATFTYDPAGRKTSLTLPNGVTVEYAYDAASRLTSVGYRTSAGVLGTLAYTYDPAGNRMALGGSLASVLLPDPVPAATYDAANRQLSLADKTMAYDANGNLTTLTEPAGTTTFTWDARNRLVALDRPGLAFRAEYDTANRRLAQEVNGGRTAYLYDGPDVAQTLGPDGTPVTYLSTLRVDEPLVRGGAETYLTDALGSVVALADASGTLTTEYRYSPFGATQATGAPSGNPFQFTGREQDATGFYLYRERYYAPVLQRFLSEDPMGLAQGPNLYTYR